jgi:hypothetical protein
MLASTLESQRAFFEESLADIERQTKQALDAKRSKIDDLDSELAKMDE